ncbi:hypothetical protein Cadr_000007313 [Camelus dromedarius]|uniref:Uncharacterized protein n=1 Tax=Camelus dromedarius TaxID=9838 RepID=A0A5N4E4V6_CAMDR|nr:hypothetical protein Cadr_000007313 [Camelus dromedarius]
MKLQFCFEETDWEGFTEKDSQKKFGIENGNRILIKEDGKKNMAALCIGVAGKRTIWGLTHCPDGKYGGLKYNSDGGENVEHTFRRRSVKILIIEEIEAQGLQDEPSVLLPSGHQCDLSQRVAGKESGYEMYSTSNCSVSKMKIE